MSMSNYRLNVHFNEDDLKKVKKAHQNVILVKNTASDVNLPATSVNFKPWHQNEVDWNSTFAKYASNSEIQNKATIKKLSDKVVTTSILYEFPGDTFGTPTRANSNASKLCIGPDVERLIFMTALGEVLASVDVPKDVLKNVDNFSVIYDNEKKEYYLQVE